MYVEFFLDKVCEVADLIDIASVNDDLAERLSYLQFLLLSCAAAEVYEDLDEIHSLFRSVIDQAFISFRIESGVYSHFACKLCVDLIGDERCDRRHHLCESRENFICSSIGRSLVESHGVALALCEESSSRSSDVPVGQVSVDELTDSPYGPHVVIRVHSLCCDLDESVVLGDDPSVEFRSFSIRHVEVLLLYLVDVRIEAEEVVCVSECAEHLADNFLNAVLVELSRSPCR